MHLVHSRSRGQHGQELGNPHSAAGARRRRRSRRQVVLLFAERMLGTEVGWAVVSWRPHATSLCRATGHDVTIEALVSALNKDGSTVQHQTSQGGAPGCAGAPALLVAVGLFLPHGPGRGQQLSIAALRCGRYRLPRHPRTLPLASRCSPALPRARARPAKARVARSLARCELAAVSTP